MDLIVKTDNLSKWYGNILGISEINLEISPGIYGLLGPNSAGKSTLLKVMTGFMTPNLGTVLLFGQTPHNNAALFRRVGYCPEYDAHYPNLSGWEYILFRARVFGLGETEATQAMQKVGLTEHMHKRIHEFSLGMKQRLKLASAIVHDPDLLILDEPLRGIDPLWRLKIIRMVRDYGKQGKTIIISSHILPEVEAMTRQIILIHQGKVFASGDIDEIRSLIDSHPHQITVRTSQARNLAKFFVGDANVLSIGFEKNDRELVSFTTYHRDHFFQKLLTFFVENELDFEEISSPDDNLQKVFDYLTGR